MQEIIKALSLFTTSDTHTHTYSRHAIAREEHSRGIWFGWCALYGTLQALAQQSQQEDKKTKNDSRR